SARFRKKGWETSRQGRGTWFQSPARRYDDRHRGRWARSCTAPVWTRRVRIGGRNTRCRWSALDRASIRHDRPSICCRPARGINSPNDPRTGGGFSGGASTRAAVTTSDQELSGRLAPAWTLVLRNLRGWLDCRSCSNSARFGEKGRETAHQG